MVARPQEFLWWWIWGDGEVSVCPKELAAWALFPCECSCSPMLKVGNSATQLWKLFNCFYPFRIMVSGLDYMGTWIFLFIIVLLNYVRLHNLFWSELISWKLYIFFPSFDIVLSSQIECLVDYFFSWFNLIMIISFLMDIKNEWCRILGISMDELRDNFDTEASDFTKHPSRFARNFLEYCCFKALSLSTQVTGHLADKKFRRLTYDMMLAWEAPAAASQPLLKVVISWYN